MERGVRAVTYAIAFSFAYLWLDAGVGALILFAAVQITMITVAMIQGERPQATEWIGLAWALGAWCISSRRDWRHPRSQAAC